MTQGAFIQGSKIGGSLMISHSLDGGFGFNLSGNSIGRNLEFDSNSGASNISGNAIGNELNCDDNSPPPVGAGNTAAEKEGQCAHL
jgi:hypothetical protein